MMSLPDGDGARESHQRPTKSAVDKDIAECRIVGAGETDRAEAVVEALNDQGPHAWLQHLEDCARKAEPLRPLFLLGGRHGCKPNLSLLR